MALIGVPVAAGGTACLDLPAQRKNIGIVSGGLLADGRPPLLKRPCVSVRREHAGTRGTVSMPVVEREGWKGP